MVTLSFLQNMSMIEWIILSVVPIAVVLWLAYRAGKMAGRLEELSKRPIDKE